MNAHNRRLTSALLVGAVALTLLPWYSLEQGFFSGDWLFSLWGDENNAPALGQLALHRWLGIAVALWLLSAASAFLPPGRTRSA
ncbi:iron ABC transporter permease, partial [Pantoea allii]